VETRRSLVACRKVVVILVAPARVPSRRSRRWRWPRHHRIGGHERSVVTLVALVVAVALMGCGAGPATASRVLALSPTAAAPLSTATSPAPPIPASTTPPSPAVTASPDTIGTPLYLSETLDSSTLSACAMIAARELRWDKREIAAQIERVESLLRAFRGPLFSPSVPVTPQWADKDLRCQSISP